MSLYRKLHELFNTLPRFTFDKESFKKAKIPPNGIYLLFEKGETVASLEVSVAECYKESTRIVHVGANEKPDNLQARLKQHATGNSKASILREHIARCLEKRDGSSPKIAIDEQIKNFYFVTFKVKPIEKLKFWKHKIIATLVNKSERSEPSKLWLGRHHPTPKICEAGLWNNQGQNDEKLTDEEFETLKELVLEWVAAPS